MLRGKKRQTAGRIEPAAAARGGRGLIQPALAPAAKSRDLVRGKKASLLAADGATVDCVKGAFGHLKAIGFTEATAPLMEKAGVVADCGVVELGGDLAACIPAAASRQWNHEPTFPTLPCGSIAGQRPAKPGH